MEARSATAPRRLPSGGDRQARRVSTTATLVREAGEVGAFSARAVLGVRGALFYFSEVLRQAAILALGTALISAVMVAVGGAECGLFGSYGLRTVGGQAYVGAFTYICGVREIGPLFFGYIFAAKVGCGLVAEI